MADNYTVKNASSATITFDSEDIGSGVQRPRGHIAAIAAGANRIGKVGIRNAADSADIDPLAGSTFTDRVGEVQGSPTANTLLARLKDILSLIVLAAGGNSIGGVKYNGVHWAAVSAVVDNADASAIADFTAAPTAGQKIVIDELYISTLTAMTLTINEETTVSTVFVHKLYIPANTPPFTLHFPGGLKLFTADKKARIQASAAGNIFVRASYHSEA